jgi:hypothetical protein
MTTIRTYTSCDIAELIEVLRASGDLSPSELAGMELLSRLLSRLEDFSDAEIEDEARRYFRSL